MRRGTEVVRCALQRSWSARIAIAALLLVPLVVVKGGGIVDDDYSAKAAAQASDAATAPTSK